MSRNSIGQFIAALRKANGMTQQDVADRLNVSNKAVSRWERDECAPDISLIPAIAEMFNVTCDEILKGQRIIDPYAMYENKQEDTQEDDRERQDKQDKKDPRVQKQLKSLVNRTLSKFKTMNYISMAISLVGMICMFGISYGFFRPRIAFGVTMLLEVGALFLAIVAVSRTKAVKSDNELFEEADESLISKFNRALGSFSFASFFAVLAVVLFGVPLVIEAPDTFGVISFNSYFTYYGGGIAVILTLIFILGRKPYYRLITGCPKEESPKDPNRKKVLIMDIVQIGIFALVILFNVLADYFKKAPIDYSMSQLIFGDVAGYVLLGVFVGFTVLFFMRNKKHIGSLILPTIRNIFLSGVFGILYNVYYISWDHNNEYPISENYYDMLDPAKYTKGIILMPENLWYALIYTMLVFAVYFIIKAIIKKVKETKNNR
ncbi:MAG: helix-turn-helix transcriptional regulator [Ruminococcaceae bacterium]|nr:helix-turn-helix transcriptional regulator [Oscillospiraceae bacterium]